AVAGILDGHGMHAGVEVVGYRIAEPRAAAAHSACCADNCAVHFEGKGLTAQGVVVVGAAQIAFEVDRLTVAAAERVALVIDDDDGGIGEGQPVERDVTGRAVDPIYRDIVGGSGDGADVDAAL